MYRYETFKYKSLFVDILLSSLIVLIFVFGDINLFTTIFDLTYQDSFVYTVWVLLLISLLSFVGVSRLNRFNYTVKVVHDLSDEEINVVDYETFFNKSLSSNKDVDDITLSNIINGHGMFDIRDGFEEVFNLIKSKNDENALSNLGMILSKSMFVDILSFSRRFGLLKKKRYGIKGINKLIDDTVKHKS